MLGRRISNIYRLGIKELFSLRRDMVLMALIVWAFSFAIYNAATGFSHDLRRGSIAIADQDGSALSLRISDAFLAPYFQEPVRIAERDIDAAMNSGEFTFVLVIPPRFEADVVSGRDPEVQLNIDATAMMQAGIGQGYVSNIIAQEVSTWLGGKSAWAGQNRSDAARIVTRYAYNQNVQSEWFTSTMEIINAITMLSIILSGAALIREREHGTIEHLLVMPVDPYEIMLAKVWANGLVILIACMLSLIFVVELVLGVPIAGSKLLFMGGVVIYLFFATALGIFLATMTRSMPQFGLLFILVVLPLRLLSGGSTPLESMPETLQNIMQFSPATHFVKYAQAILFRGAGIEVVWPEFLLVFAIGVGFFAFSALRFRKSIAQMR
ncbi:ABC transporter permease [Thalassospira sp. A40-3]|uniref:ABC transporter permease n=1 Tax=Thalassospira sp. A40-3 TaxID=2785908 RepID=UPI0018CCE460|nr:ABC transporter permease [Thalassospira sp. A40-3]QPO10316.1 ABC transporter permease [Thalassospira sp. A40-3]